MPRFGRISAPTSPRGSPRSPDEPTTLAALQLSIVGGYYTDKRVRELIGYPGQEAIEVKSWLFPPTSRKA